MNRSAWFLAAVAATWFLREVAPSAPSDRCSPTPQIFELMTVPDPTFDPDAHVLAIRQLSHALATENTTALLGPSVLLDLTLLEPRELPIHLTRCTTLKSVLPLDPRNPGDGPSARTPQSLGPIVKLDAKQESVGGAFEVNCNFGSRDHVRISGFQLIGPSQGQQTRSEVGIRIIKCKDIEVSNMEISGWGEQAVHVLDEASPGEVGRIDFPSEVRIFGNFIHHNQHPSDEGHSAGYGVEVNHGAWADISTNVFDFNRHAVMGAGDMGGYDAHDNLVLKGGGLHRNDGIGDVNYTTWTHQFDIHGTEGGSGRIGRPGGREDALRA